MHAKKAEAWTPDKKWMHSTKTYYTRSVPCNVFGHLAVAMGKGLAWATWQNSENQKICSLGPLGGCNGQRGGEGGMSTPGMQKHTHMLSQGVVVATSHKANIHNLSVPSDVILVLQTWAVSQMHSQFQAPGSIVSLNVFTSVSLPTATISIYLYRSVHLDMHP